QQGHDIQITGHPRLALSLVRGRTFVTYQIHIIFGHVCLLLLCQRRLKAGIPLSRISSSNWAAKDLSVSSINDGGLRLLIIEIPSSTMFIAIRRSSVRRSSLTAIGLNNTLPSRMP